MSDIELLIAFKRAEAIDIINLTYGVCEFSDECGNCPADRACEHLASYPEPWPEVYANFRDRLTKPNINTRLSTLQRHYPEYFL